MTYQREKNESSNARRLPEAGDEQSGIESGEKERLLSDGLQRHLECGRILLPDQIVAVAEDGEAKSESDPNALEDDGRDGSTEEDSQSDLGGATEVRVRGGGFAECDAGIEARVDDENSRAGLHGN